MNPETKKQARREEMFEKLKEWMKGMGMNIDNFNKEMIEGMVEKLSSE